MKKIGIALLGSGRMAQVYGPKINAHPGLNLAVVFNPNLESAQAIVNQYGGKALGDLDATLANPNVDAVLIATPANTHLEYVLASAKAGKPTFCEKPLDQSLERAEQCIEVLKTYPVPFMLGFNRRFDPDIIALQKAVRSGELGQLSFLMSTSREPFPPPLSYLQSSGGYFVDATIHDIDLMCWISGERPIEVFATGSCLTDPAIGKLGDCDTAMTTLKMPSGCLVHINNSRQCSYGFDQRIEAFGEKGMLQTTNQRDENLIRWDESKTDAKAPLKHFFLERYDASFSNELDEFYQAITEARTPSCTVQDGRDALAIALACIRSHQTGVAVKLNWI
ncbi:MAG: inositol 2-dehydrogenase [Amylibacter sp.]|jgi:myo-inositol 2-dehydrogenase/D-chiro-inositol 1-dehydrogenase|tara:strand:+ start:419 stop:1426 length:1008 start_codon:yes stop_codon:yes gene_type:complete